MFPSLGRNVGERGSVGEVNCRELRGSARGPARVILWGRYCGRCVCVCAAKRKRQEASKSLQRERRDRAPSEGAGVNECDEREKREQGVREENGERRRGKEKSDDRR